LSAVPVLEIGGTHVAGALVEVEVERATPDIVAGSRIRAMLDADGSADSILASVLDCARGLSAEPGLTWGVAIPGPFDYAAGIGQFEGVAKFASLYGVDVGRALRDRLPPGSRVVFLNDAVAFLIGEWAAGAGTGHDRLAGITLGTGIGSAFLAGGRVIEDGPDVPPGGEVHRLRIGGRPLEDTVSRRAILAEFGRLTGERATGPKLDVIEIAGLARSGDDRARTAIQGPLRALGAALSPWLQRFGASALVVGGSMAGSWDLVEPALRSSLPGSVELLRARRPDDAGLIGAGIFAIGSMRGVATRHTAPADT
jgi:glucokinase